MIEVPFDIPRRGYVFPRYPKVLVKTCWCPPALDTKLQKECDDYRLLKNFPNACKTISNFFFGDTHLNERMFLSIREYFQSKKEFEDILKDFSGAD